MRAAPLNVLLVFLRLGCLSFGGPVAHIAYFRDEFVRRRAWLTDDTFAECVALTQLLPGPGSSQTGMLIGWLAAGPLGAFAAWIGFTLPSAVLMALAALAFGRLPMQAAITHGLLLVAVAVVASAVLTMRASLAPDPARVALALGALLVVLVLPFSLAMPLAIALSALAGAVLLHGRITTAQPSLDLGISRRAGIAILGVFTILLIVLHVAALTTSQPILVLVDTLARVGSLVFGGGHIVLPLLQSQVATAGIVDQHAVLTGYSAAQAMPGPLFTIASYVGAAAFGGALGVRGALAGTVAIFAPSFFLLAGVAPFYRTLAHSERFRAALAGANAGVVGILASAFINPIVSSTVHSIGDTVFALVAFVALYWIKIPSWLLVLLGGLAGFALFR